jgi:hypothetical protein
MTTKFTQRNRKASEPSPLCFTPERAVAAIAFHLVDEAIAKSVSAESAQRTIKRLRHESFALSISARTWAVMSNVDRLRRLLEETATEAALLPDGTLILAHRARQKS